MTVNAFNNAKAGVTAAPGYPPAIVESFKAFDVRNSIATHPYLGAQEITPFLTLTDNLSKTNPVMAAEALIDLLNGYSVVPDELVFKKAVTYIEAIKDDVVAGNCYAAFQKLNPPQLRQARREAFERYNWISDSTLRAERMRHLEAVYPSTLVHDDISDMAGAEFADTLQQLAADIDIPSAPINDLMFVARHTAAADQARREAALFGLAKKLPGNAEGLEQAARALTFFRAADKEAPASLAEAALIDYILSHARAAEPLQAFALVYNLARNYHTDPSLSEPLYTDALAHTERASAALAKTGSNTWDLYQETQSVAKSLTHLLDTKLAPRLEERLHVQIWSLADQMRRHGLDLEKENPAGARNWYELAIKTTWNALTAGSPERQVIAAGHFVTCVDDLTAFDRHIGITAIGQTLMTLDDRYSPITPAALGIIGNKLLAYTTPHNGQPSIPMAAQALYIGKLAALAQEGDPLYDAARERLWTSLATLDDRELDETSAKIMKNVASGSPLQTELNAYVAERRSDASGAARPSDSHRDPGIRPAP